MNSLGKSVLCVGLAAASLFAVALPAFAQATHVARGSGAVVANNGALQQLAFNLIVLPDGRIRGHVNVIEPASGGIVKVEITSMMFIGDDLFVAGPVTAAIHAPPAFSVGATAFFGFQDNLGAPDALVRGVVPVAFGNLSIQEIIAFIGPPPPQAWLPLVSGDITIH